MKKKTMIKNNIYALFILIILGGVLEIVDFRLGYSDRFTLINDCIAIFILIYILYCLFGGKAYVYNDIKKIQLSGGVFIFYIILECIISISINGEVSSSILAIKNLLMPICIFFGGTFIFNKIECIDIVSILKVLNVFSVLNIILVVLGLALGWEVMTKYILGESLYAFPVYSFGNSGSMVRVPGMFVDALTQGAFSYLVFLFNFIAFIENKFINRRYSIIFSIIGLIGVMLSTNRQIMLGTLISMIVFVVIKLKKIFISMICLFGVIFIIGFIFISNSSKSLFSMESLGMRNQVWSFVTNDMKLSDNFLNLFIGTGVDATTLGRGGAGITLVDNSYLLMFHDYGLIGIVLFVLFYGLLLKFLYKNFNKNPMAKVGFLYMIFFMVRMLFHSSIVNEYDSYAFYIIVLISIKNILYSNNIVTKK